MADKRRSFALTQSFARSQRRRVDGALLDQVLVHYEAGRYLDAFKLASTAGPLQSWTGANALATGARLAANLTAERLSHLLITRAHREHPEDAHVALFYAYHLVERQGPMAAWRYAADVEEMETPTDACRADFLALRARIAATYRDFDTAWRFLERAFAVEESPWLLVEKAAVLQAQERRQEALATVEQALELRPLFRPAVQFRGQLLHVLNRLQDAIEFLTESLRVLQSGPVALQLLHLKREADDDEGMLELLDRFEALSPMLDRARLEWLAARRADVLHLQGDFPAAAGQAELVDHEYYRDFAKRLRTATAPQKRVRLSFRFIPQGRHTCGPATLAAIAQHWGAPVTQEAIVEAICYDGTYDHTERRWCESNGFAAREFKVTWDALRLLLDARVPFALATVEVGSAHLQAVIGYDELRETIFIQDPGEPHYREVLAKEFLDNYRLTGPRGMAVVRTDRREWLEALNLPEAGSFDLNYAFQAALGRHQREGAEGFLEELERREPGCRLALMARLALAGFDGNTLERARVLERLLVMFPDDQRLLAWRLASLREHGRREERCALLKHAVCLKDAHPLFTKELAQELAADMRHSGEARRLLWRAHRLLPQDSSVLTEIAEWEWRRARSEDLLHFYRFASALSDKNERFARTWFDAASAFGHTEEALEWLRKRFESYGAKSGAPAISFSEGLDRLFRTDEALATLAKAIALRPTDGELLVEASRLETRCGLLDQAQAHLEAARGLCPPRLWLRAAAALHGRRGESAQALAIWREVLEREPLAMDAHQEVARHLASLEGETAALRHLEEACTRFPHHHGLGQARLRMLRASAAEAAESVARTLVEIHPEDTWSRRELALILEEAGRHEEALHYSQSAIEIAPGQPASHGVHGSVLMALGREGEAAEHFRTALRCDVNYGWACEALVDLMRDTRAKRAELDFVRAEMNRQVLNGAALHAYRRAAYAVIEPLELAEQLRQVWQARPDLWQAWSILASQQWDAGARTEAEQLARDATVRFSLLPGAWRDLAVIERLLGKSAESLAAARRVLDLNPDWAPAWQDLARFLEEAGRAPEAIEALRKAVKRLPMEESLRLALADVLWRANQREEAWLLASRVAEDEPGQLLAWEHLRQWTSSLHREGDLVGLARRVAKARPGQAQSWMTLASVLPADAIDERLEAYDAAIARNPRLVDAYDLKAELLAGQGRFEAAEAVLHSGPWNGNAPVPLQGRLAWLKASRGETSEALREMAGVLERNGDYYWGWERLAEWGKKTDATEQWRRAAENLMRLAPRAAEPFCHAAAVEFHLGHREQATSLLKHALQLEPSHGHASRMLMESLWERRDAGALEALPSLLLQGGPTLWVSHAALGLAAVIREDVPRARTHLESVVSSRDEMGWLADWLERAFLKEPANSRAMFLALLEKGVAQKQIGPSFARVWIRQQAREKKWGVWVEFAGWIDRMGERAVPAIAEFLEQISESGQAGSAVPALIERHRKWLSDHTFLWGKTGFALTQAKLYDSGVHWLRGGEKRPDAEGWMLANLIVCLRETGQHTAASEVSLTVVRRGLHDKTWGWHVSQAAIGAAERGDFETARNILPLADSESLSGGWRVTHTLASALCRVLAAPVTEARTIFAEEHERIRRAAKAAPKPRASLVSEYNRALGLMLRHTGAAVRPWKKSYPRTSTSPQAKPGSREWLIGVFIIVALGRACQDCSAIPSSCSPPAEETPHSEESVPPGPR
jgi:cellulose synthase operon protein C